MMKSAKEIMQDVNWPNIKDMFGNDIIPGDVIGMTSTASRKIDPFIVTKLRSTSGSGNIVLLSLDMGQRYKYTASLDPNDLSKATTKCYQNKTLVKLNNTLPSYLLERAQEQLKQLYKEKEDNKIKAKEKLKSAIQVRMFPVFIRNKKTNELYIQFRKIESQPGKVISRTDTAAAIRNVLADINANSQDWQCVLRSKSKGLVTVSNYMADKFKLELDPTYCCDYMFSFSSNSRKEHQTYNLSGLYAARHAGWSTKRVNAFNDSAKSGVMYKLVKIHDKNGYSKIKCQQYDNYTQHVSANWTNPIRNAYAIVDLDENETCFNLNALFSQSMLNDFETYVNVINYLS